jgi:DNA polymerase III alpha subunit
MEERPSKKGGTFLTLIMEDYNETVKYNWFEERTFLKYKHFLQPGTFLYMRGRVEKEKYNENYRFVINSVDLLHKLRDRIDKPLELEVNSLDLNQIFVQWLYEILNEHSGNMNFKITVVDDREGLKVELSPRGMRINLDNELITELAKNAIKVSIN